MKKSKLKIAKKIEKVEEKVVHTWGKFIERPRRTETLVCACSNRYIKTRKNQTECVPCMVRSRV
jgi:hypothetical protein